jgi:hypothetical protein
MAKIAAWIVAIMLTSAACIGCGVPLQQVKANQEALRQAEAARAEAAARAAERARMEQEARTRRIAAAEKSGDEAAGQGQYPMAFAHYVDALAETEKYGAEDTRIREKAVRLGKTMSSPPAFPEEAMRRMVRGQTRLRMGGAGSMDAAAAEMEEAVLAAPWWTDGYYNLSVVQEKAGRYDRALRNLRLYLLGTPDSAESRAAQVKIYELEVKREEAAKTAEMKGRWKGINGGVYIVTVEGRTLKVAAYGGITAEMNGLALEGTIRLPQRHSDYCDIPGETAPLTGRISPDRRKIELWFQRSEYRTSKRFVGLAFGTFECTGVALSGKTDLSMTLIRTN